jgi:hypothetical protein
MRGIGRVVLGDLKHRASASQVNATITCVGDECVVASQPHHVERRAHPGVRAVLGRISPDGGIRTLDGSAELGEHLAAGGEIGALRVVFDTPLRSPLPERRAHDIDGELGSDVARLVTPHPVRDREDRQIRREQSRVFVTFAMAAGVRGQRVVQAKVEPG